MTSKKQLKTISSRQDISDIYAEYQSPLKGFIAKRVPSKEDCEDILQNVFYQLSKIDLEVNPIEQVSGWLYSVARNQIIDRSRKKDNLEFSHDENFDSNMSFVQEITETLFDSNSPETDFMKGLVWEELDIALEELSLEQREVFELTELEGVSFKEISEATGIGINTLLSRKRYAVVHLRKRLYDLYLDLLID